MGSTWAKHLQLLRVERSAVPTRVTVIVPYYENPIFFARQIEIWRAYPSDLRAQIAAVIVDDGSPVPAALPVDPPFPMRLFRITQDVRWNWLAARNIGAHHADEGWLLLTDMDHVIPSETMAAVLYGVHRVDTIYGFSRVTSQGVDLHPHPNSWLMTRQMFWRVGGYDETLSGTYGTDGDWRRRCAATAPMAILTEPLVRHEHEADASTTRYLRKQPIDAAVKQIVAKRLPGWQPKVLSFPYQEVAP